MGIAADLFYSTADVENTLDWRIRPSNEQFEAQQERWNDLRDHLVSDLRARSGYTIDSWLQGSYKFGTQIRPAKKGREFDIDLGVYFCWAGEPDDGNCSPAELKAFVQESLGSYAEDEANDAQSVAEPKARCSRIHFDEHFHIDVPAYHLDRDRDARALATSEDRWEDSDPKAIYTWWKNEFDDAARARARRIVRYLKMWAALQFKDDEAAPSSILLTVLAALAFGEIDADELSGDDEVLCAIASTIRDRLARSYHVPNPVNSDEDLNRLSDEECDVFVDRLEGLVGVAGRALSCTSKIEAAECWAEAFGYFFPIPSEEEILVERAQSAVALAFKPQIEVYATAKNGKVWKGVNQIGPIPKGCDLKFSLANWQQLPAGATVSWTVRNAGVEAEVENDLGHSNVGGFETTEKSAYRGTHSMDVAIKVNGRLIAFQRVPVKITGLGLPARNPPRPAYVRFR